MEKRNIIIDPLSVRSLLLVLTANGNKLSTATGFVVQRNKKYYLVTNWHVLSGRNTETNEPMSSTAAIPDEIHIFHHAKDKLGFWLQTTEKLIDSHGNKIWKEHLTYEKIDIAILELTHTNNIDFYPLDLELADVDMIPQPAMPISILGFPFGLSSGGSNGLLPIWKTGHIATDPDIDYDGKPAFLIDATTRGGMSGSPVVLRMSSGYTTKNGNMIMGSSMQTKFLGVYSGRIHGDSEIGRVWRPHLIDEIINS